METLDHIELAQRTRLRNGGTWVSFDWGGLMAPLMDQQSEMDYIARASIENFLAISDEAWGIKEHQRDRATEIAQVEVDQDRQIAYMKGETGRQKLAIRKATDEYELAAKVYDARVKAIVMAAREFAGLVEQQQLALEALRAGLAISKEELHQKELQAKIYYEMIQRAQVEVDLAKAQVEVAKANVRALMADISAGEAEVKVIEAQVAVAMAEAEKATLQADVASIFAEILTHQLSKIKLDVGRAEIQAGFGFIQSRLEDELKIWDTRTAMETLQAALEGGIQEEIRGSLIADEYMEDLRGKEMDANVRVFDTDRVLTAINLIQEEALKQRVVVSRNKLSDARLAIALARDDKESWVRALLNEAQRYLHKHTQRGVTSFETNYEYITGE